MRLGSNIYYKCPNCGRISWDYTILSGNTFGAAFFSDCRRIASMLPEFSELTICENCDTIFWLTEQNRIDYVSPERIYSLNGHRVDFDDKPKSDTNIKVEFGLSDPVHNPPEDRPCGVVPLDLNLYYRALLLGVAENKDEERYIRIKIWWIYNDCIKRRSRKYFSKADELRWIKNMKKLIKLLDQSDINQRIMIAELYRNLAKFETSISILNTIEEEKFNWIKEILIYECTRKNKWVVRLIKS